MQGVLSPNEVHELFAGLGLIEGTGKETLTVSGHAIDCYIIESSVSAKAIGIKSEMKQKVWYGRGIGQVKTEGYSKKGKLVSVNELVEVTGL